MRPYALIPFLILFAASPLAAQTCLPNVPREAPNSRYVVSQPIANQRVVTDNSTGLMWKHCTEGLSGTSCNVGSPASRTWTQALSDANTSTHAGFNDWRLPSIMELRSLVESACHSPSINSAIFPATSTDGYYWSSTNSYWPAINHVWIVRFNYGHNAASYKAYSHNIRLVRGGKAFDAFMAEGDATPNNFNLVDQNDVPVLSVRTSDPITVAGITTVTGIGVSGATGSRYSINSTLNANFTATPGVVKNGDVVRVRHTSAVTPFTTTTTTLTIGGVSDDFVTTTARLDQNISFDTNPGPLTYGGASASASATASSGLNVIYGVTVASESVCSVDISTGAITILAAGNCIITANQPGNASYNPALQVTQTVQIAPRAVTVMADAKSKTYGEVDPVLTASVTMGSLADADTIADVTGTLTRAPGENVGDYAVALGTGVKAGNYAITYVAANLTIGQRAVTVTAETRGKIYGTTDPTLTYTIAPALVNGDSLTGMLSRVAGEGIGNYAITQGSLAASTNYTLSFVGANFTITPLAITVTANAGTKVYGTADPVLAYTVTPALVNGDSLNGVLSRAAGETVGNYAINQGTLTASSNYTLSFVGANFTITPLAITVTAEAKTKVYGTTDPVLTYTVAPELVNGDSLTGVLSRAAGETVGDYTITQGSLAASSNYTLSFVGANFAVTPLVITVTANAGTKVYGTTDPVLTYTVTPALVDGDSLTGVLTRAAGEAAGNYAINQGSLSAGVNYTLDFVGANFAITPLAITVTANPGTKVYGTANPTLTYTVVPALVSGDTFTGTLARAAGENVGNYAINQGTLAASGSYTLSFVSANFAITPLAITVTANVASKTYGESDPPLTYGVTPALVNGDSFSGNLTREPGENAGVYGILQGSLTAGDNYTSTFHGANFTIHKAAQATLNAIANPVSILFNGTSALSASGGSGTGALSYAVTAGVTACEVAGNTLTGIGLGTCTVTATKAADSNYLAATGTAEVTVTPRADLEIAKDANRASALIGDTVVFSIVVANIGPNDVAGANIVDSPPATLVDVEWACVPSASSIACPAAPHDAGTGAMSVLVNLPAGTHLRYDLSGTVQGAIGAQIQNTARVTVPSGTTDPTGGNNNATASVLIVPIGVFADGFEAEQKNLKVPAAERVRIKHGK